MIEKIWNQIKIKKSVNKDEKEQQEISFAILITLLLFFILLQSLTIYFYDNVVSELHILGVIIFFIMTIPCASGLLFGLASSIFGIVRSVLFFKKFPKKSIALFVVSIFVFGSIITLPSENSWGQKIVDPVIHRAIDWALQQNGKTKKNETKQALHNFRMFVAESQGMVLVIDSYDGKIYFEGGKSARLSVRDPDGSGPVDDGSEGSRVKLSGYVQHFLKGKRIRVEMDEHWSLEEPYLSKISLNHQGISAEEIRNFTLSNLDLESATPKFQKFYGYDANKKEFKSSSVLFHKVWRNKGSLKNKEMGKRA